MPWFLVNWLNILNDLLLKSEKSYTVKKKNIVAYIDKCRYDIQEQNEFQLWYTGINRPISNISLTVTSKRTT